MDRNRHLYAAERHFGRAARVHALDLLQPLIFKPGTDLERRNHRRASAFCNLNHIRNMIAVPVRDENKIRGDLLDIDLCGERIGRDERVEEERAAAGLDRETSVAVVGKLHGDT